MILWYLLAGLATVTAGYLMLHLAQGMWGRQKLYNRRSARRREVEAAFDKLRKQLQNQDKDSVDALTSKTLVELKELLDKQQISSLELLQAFQVKALQAHELTNCLVEPIKEAEAEARSRDASKGEERRGLLHGIPVSIKDDYCIKGYITAFAVSAWMDQVAEDDCALVKVLRQQGAVPFVRTNIPQTELSGTSGNPTYGAVGNPYNTSRSPGGSSSGEAALLAYGGSPLGFGSDIAGSIRVPAHFSGICGLRPTSTRIGHRGMLNRMGEDALLINATRGPMARDVETVALATRALWHENALNKLDPRTIPIPFLDQIYRGKRSLKIGYYVDNGTVEPVPAIARSVHMAKKHLEDAGHEVIPWTIPHANVAVELLWSLLFADGGARYREMTKNEPIDPAMKFVMSMLNAPYVCRWLYSKLLKLTVPDYVNIWQYTLGKPTSADILELKTRIEKYKLDVSDSWCQHELDAVICPVFPFPAPPREADRLIFVGFAYTLPYNVLDFPAGVVRMTKVTSEDQDKMKTSYTRLDAFHREVREAMVGAEGLPVGVQVVGLHGHDEMVLRVMKEIEGACDF